MQEMECDLSGFHGSETIYRLYSFSKISASEGVKYLADKCECYWLFDIIMSYQTYHKVRKLDIQFWEIETVLDKVKVRCLEDRDIPPVVQQTVYSDCFPEGEFMLYFQNNLILLPSEY